jgi:hypothetical protein
MRTLACVLAASVGASGAVQESTPLAPDARLQRFVGAWQGEGTLELMAGARAVPWRGTSEFDWVLGGAFLRQRLAIARSDAIPNGIEAEAFYGWHPERKRYDLVWIDSLGHLRAYAGQWSDEATFVAARRTRFAGLPRLDRQVVRVDPQGGFAVELQAAVGTAALSAEIAAQFTRAPASSVAPMPAGKPGPELAAFARLAGAYTVAVEEPSAQRLWRGTLRGGFALGGVALRCELALGAEGKQEQPHALWCLGFDAEQERASYVSLEHDGTIMTGTASWPAADTLVLLGHAQEAPRTERVQVTFGPDGNLRCVHDVSNEQGAERIVLRGTPAR